MDGAREYNAKWNKSERQMLYDFTHVEFKKQNKWAKETKEANQELDSEL